MGTSKLKILDKVGGTVGRVYELAKPLAEELSLSIWDVVFEKEGASWYLRVFIDKDEGISLSDCEAFSRPFNKILDEWDFIKESYIFEVGSPGLGRELRRPEHFQKCMGADVKALRFQPVDGAREVSGALDAFDAAGATAVIGGTTYNLSDFSIIRLDDDGDDI